VQAATDRSGCKIEVHNRAFVRQANQSTFSILMGDRGPSIDRRQAVAGVVPFSLRSEGYCQKAFQSAERAGFHERDSGSEIRF
jgi:hypothetical protein